MMLETPDRRQKARSLFRNNTKLSTTSVVATTTIFLFALVLLHWLRRHPIASWLPYIPSPSHVPETRSSRLSPERHVFRDAITREYTWRVTKGLRRPDGVLKPVYLINDAFPSPAIEARSGDRLVIKVENAIDDEGLSLHWHGLHMRNANHMDGAAGVTQSPIAAGRSFTYDFVIDLGEHGTFWWHAHDAVQRADGLYGGLVVHEPRERGEVIVLPAEHLLLIGDWYHRSAEEALAYYMHPGAFGLETVPDSLLVNGKGRYHCSDAVRARPVDCISFDHPPHIANLDSDREQILRVVNVGAYAGFSISMNGSALMPLAVDAGHPVAGFASKSVGILRPGERADLRILGTKDVSTVEGLTVTLHDEPFKYENLALTLAHRFSAKWTGPATRNSDHDDAALYEQLDLQTLVSAHDQRAFLPEKAQQVVVLYTLTQKLAHLNNEPRGFINSTTWAPQAPPLIDAPRNEWSKNQFVPHIKYNAESPSWIDVVLNNLDEDSHPFHLHGHDFWVISSHSSDLNWGSYNPFEDATPPGGPYNLTHALRKDTYYVPRRGYAVLRFLAENKGIWMFHCHVLWHQASGMSMAFDIRPD